MSPLPVAAAAGVIKAGTAKSMAKAFTMMQKTDWEGVNNAMVSMKDFAESASIVQETLADIKEQAQGLADIALATAMSQLAEAFNKVFVSLEPIATMIDKLVTSLDAMGISVFAADERVENALKPPEDMFDVRQAWEDFWSWLFAPPTETPTETPITRDRESGLLLFEEGF